MGLRDSISKFFSAQKQGPLYGIHYLKDGEPPKANMEQYLRMYGEIGWLHACVSHIASSVAEDEWSLFEIGKDGSRQEVTTEHEIKTVLSDPNPYQTGHELIKTTQIFIDLVGEAYWVIDGGQIWCYPPHKMQVVPDTKGGKFISGYVFNADSKKIPLKAEDVIPFISPNPLNPLRGISPAQSIGIELDTQSFALQHNRNWFYRGAAPGMVIMYPENIPEGEYDRLKASWDAEHRGYGRAHTTAILTGGGKAEVMSMNNREMDFVKLMAQNRDAILGAYGMPYSVLGGAEHINRATATAAQVDCATRVTRPRLVFLREKLNKFLVPRFSGGKNMELDFDNPVPADDEANINKVASGVQHGWMTINEAREALDMDDIPNGDVLLWPINMTPTPVEEGRKLYIPPKYKIFSTEAQKEAYWNLYVKEASQYEPKALSSLRKFFEGQRKEALKNLEGAHDREHVLIDVSKAKKAYSEAMVQILGLTITDGIKRGQRLINPKSVKASVWEDLLTLFPAAAAFLKHRLGWAAEEITQETGDLLAEQLRLGFEAGESADLIADRIQQVFDFCSNVRSERIARTEIMYMSNQGAVEGYKSSGIQKVEFYCALDERTCDVCLDENGDILSVDDVEGMLPLHPNCRCTFLPVT